MTVSGGRGPATLHRTPFALLLLALPAPGRAQCPPAAVIDTVIVDNGGAAESGLVNFLHIRTRAGVVRRTMLVRAGDCYDAARVAEGERALWNLGVFRTVYIDTIRIDSADGSSRLALRVGTADGWSARPVGDYSRTGSQTIWEAGVIERNFLGTASQVFVNYRSTPDRGSLSMTYYSPYFIFPGVILFVQHSVLSNGYYTGAVAGLPFREARARYSATLGGENTEEQALAYADPTGSGARGRGVRFRFNAGYAPLATSRGYLRVWTGARWRYEGYAPSDTASFIMGTYATAGIGLEGALVRYRNAQRLNTIGRPEWVDLSPSFRLGVWTGPRAWGYGKRAGVGGELHTRVAAGWSTGYAAVQVDASGGFVRQVLDSGQLRGKITIVAQRRRHTLILHADGGQMIGRYPPGQYDIWLEGRGPRLFAPHSFMGEQMWWAIVEDRVMVREALAGMLGVGVAPFVELASSYRRWGPDARGGNAGLAVRLVPLRFASNDVTEVAVGYRFGRSAPRPGWALGLRKGIWF